MQRVNKIVCAKLKELLPKVTIFPAIAEEDARYPYVVYNMDGFSVDRDKDSETRSASYSVEIWSDDFDKCDKMADAVDAGFRDEIGEGVEASVVGGSSGYAGAYYSKLQFDLEIE